MIKIISPEIVTAGLTLSGGVILFMISELMRGFIIKPVIAMREHIGLIVDRIIFWENKLTSGVQIDAGTEAQIT